MTAPTTAAPALDRATLDRRIRRWGAWYLTEHQLRGMAHYRATLIATAIGTPVLYLFAFGIGLATLITGNVVPGGAGDGISYIEFVAPALLVTAGVLVASEEFTFGVLLPLKWNPVWVGTAASPLTPRQMVDGKMIFVGIRMLVTCVIYYVVILAFGAVPSAWGVLTIVVGMLGGFAFAPVAAYSASIRDDRGQFAVLQRVIILPLTLFSGTVFPLTQLPLPLQWIGWVSPLWHASELGRQFAYGPTEPIWLTLVHFGYLVALTVVGWVLCVGVVRRRLTR